MDGRTPKAFEKQINPEANGRMCVGGGGRCGVKSAEKCTTFGCIRSFFLFLFYLQLCQYNRTIHRSFGWSWAVLPIHKLLRWWSQAHGLLHQSKRKQPVRSFRWHALLRYRWQRHAILRSRCTIGCRLVDYAIFAFNDTDLPVANLHSKILHGPPVQFPSFSCSLRENLAE